MKQETRGVQVDLVNNFNTEVNFLLLMISEFFSKCHLQEKTGLPTKDETSEIIVRNLDSLFSCIQGSFLGQH